VWRAGFDTSGLDWSPSGQQVVWSNFDGLVISNVRTGARHRIPLPGYSARDPAWSPDGEWIAYSNGGSIKLVRPTGGTPRTVTDLPGMEVLPAWSPDGNWIGFTRHMGTWRHPEVSLAVTRPYGTNSFKLLRTGGVDASPSWSSDGSRLAAYSDGSKPFGAAPHPGLWTTGKWAGPRQRELVVPGRAITEVAW
jgi:dipeptidyl aminopeptidase/acylaminoacyl peptidase